MDYPKSNPDLGSHPLKRNSRRQSRELRHSKQMKDYEFKIQNPFRLGNQQNLLPPHIQSQIQQMEYISSKSIKNIEMKGCRTSNFMKNLQIMQQLAKKQQQKYGMLKQGVLIQDKMKNCQQNDHELLPISIGDDDRISIELNGIFDDRQRVYDDFNMFQNQMVDNMVPEQPHFYSVQEIQPNFQMEDQVNNYLG